MTEAFRARVSTFIGTLVVQAGIEDVFPLFSPQGEKLWVPEWNPEILHPRDAEWQEGQVFRTREEDGDAVWVVTRLQREQYEVEYHRVEPRRYVAHIEVRCREMPPGRTEVSATYSFVGLTDSGNRDIIAMTQEAYDAKMSRWSDWIDRHLKAEADQC